MKNVSLKFVVSASAVAIVACTVPQTVKAQSATDSESGLEEITVTARKRSETLLQVPVSVAAFDSALIQQEGIYDLNDVAALTPGFSIDNLAAGRNDRSFQTPIIRGMTPTFSSGTTSVFIDGTPNTGGFIAGAGDLDRVEILKGPQSAYFGRATFAGAINVITKKPSDDFKISADALFGSDNWHDVTVTAEGAIVPGILSVRASVRDFATSGQYRNNGDSGGTLGDQSTKSASLAINATPTDNLSIKLFGTYWHDSDGPAASGVFTAQDYNCSTGSASPAGTKNYICGSLPSLANSRPAQDTLLDALTRAALIDDTTLNGTQLGRTIAGPDQLTGHGGLERDAYHLHSAIDYEIPDWGITISSLTAANMDHYSVIQDYDEQATTGLANLYYGVLPNTEPYQNTLFSAAFFNNDVSQEFRVASDQTERFRWTVGTSYLHELNKTDLVANVPAGSFQFANPAPFFTDTYAVFGSMSYDVLDNLTVSFDARYQLDHQVTYNENNQGSDSFVGSANFHNFLPRVIVQYKVDPDVMVYASWAQGANVGGLNTTLLQLTPSALASVQKNYGVTLDVQPETTEQYEVGIKGKFWDNRITVATDIYAGTWTNQIASIPITFLIHPPAGYTTTEANVNLGKTDLFGWEFDGAVKPIDHLVINGAAGIAETDIRNYVCQACVAIDGSTNVKGNQLPNYPKWQADVGVEWSDALPIIQDMNYYLRGEAVYRDITYTDFTNLTWTPASVKINFRAGVRTDNYSLEGFVLNAFNDKAFITSSQGTNSVGNPFALTVAVGLAQLTQFGVRLRYTFDAGHEAPAAPAASYAPPPVVAPAATPKTARSYMVFFDFNKSDLSAQAVTIVDTAAKNAGSAKVTEIEVTGHTDTVGSDAYNMRLSRRRAEAVATELKKQGIPSSEIAIFAKGKKDLLVPTADGVREPQNRRVQILYQGGSTS